jgi:hypothetical protein
MNQNPINDGMQNRFLISLCYPLALVLVILPLSDTLIGLIQPRVGDMQWRVGAVGLVSGAMVMPLVGCFIALVAAHLLNHVWRRRLIASACGLAGILFVVTFVLFALDLVQIRREIAPQALRPYDVAAVKGLITVLGEGCMFLALSIITFRHERMAAKQAAGANRLRTSTVAPLAAPVSQ